MKRECSGVFVFVFTLIYFHRNLHVTLWKRSFSQDNKGHIKSWELSRWLSSKCLPCQYTGWISRNHIKLDRYRASEILVLTLWDGRHRRMNPKTLMSQVAWYIRQRTKRACLRDGEIRPLTSTCPYTHSQYAKTTQNITENLEARTSPVYSMNYVHLLEFFLLTPWEHEVRGKPSPWEYNNVFCAAQTGIFCLKVLLLTRLCWDIYFHTALLILNVFVVPD